MSSAPPSNATPEQPVPASSAHQASAPLGLPAPSDAPPSSTPGEEPQTSFKLDHLGPVIVNTDGTMSRISGWTDMTDVEKQRSLRLLAKRNNARMQALRDADAEGADGTGQAQ
ncbi:uncharacterized protein PFL1_01838 [Pseudozyma flocculosa PF-1]|uniref:Fungal specific transcription factor n=1 Tax=Pseudozyma flocculosa TaxID=84751 RepID=A0A5C3EXR4_9BASI|nr:uncharacterized protein PFL1_01838 [Pseudozyma flocculosa PF-1]EPQ30940.1 hypothetical protein PFL1_01838 [Pseudozyma flocculosa PF-1]SPO36670.1 uncharacterized protein PSFLO_02141 [Pseudozyma flocculosa]